MKFYASLFTVIACLFVFSGCAEPPRHQVTVVELAPIPVPEPEIKTLTLIVGKTTRDDVEATLGQPNSVTTHSTYNQASWMYTLNKQNIIWDVSVTGKDGYINKTQWDLRKNFKVFSLMFKGNLLNDVMVI